MTLAQHCVDPEVPPGVTSGDVTRTGSNPENCEVCFQINKRSDTLPYSFAALSPGDSSLGICPVAQKEVWGGEVPTNPIPPLSRSGKTRCRVLGRPYTATG